MGNKLTYFLTTVFILVSCGGGGGGNSNNTNTSPGYGNNNNAPQITNSSANVSAVENQTSTFTVTASDADGDSLTFSISGDDSNLFTIGSSSGIVTFITAPDYENPSDEDNNNVYVIIASVTDGTSSDNMTFNINVTNDTADDISSENYDGKVIAAGPVQGASVCFVENITEVCSSAQFQTESLQDGSFSLAVEDNPTGFIKTEGGFDPNTNWAIPSNEGLSIGHPTIEQNFLISLLVTLFLTYIIIIK